LEQRRTWPRASSLPGSILLGTQIYGANPEAVAVVAVGEAEAGVLDINVG